MDLTKFMNTCPVCGTQFPKQRYHPKTYCSEVCSKKAYKQQHPGEGQDAVRAWQAEHKDQMDDRRYRRTYRMSKKDYDAMLDAQGGVCAICGRADDGSGHKLSVDHNHETGAVRGLLCHRCNASLGCLDDDPTRFRKAADYLDRYSS